MNVDLKLSRRFFFSISITFNTRFTLITTNRGRKALFTVHLCVRQDCVNHDVDVFFVLHTTFFLTFSKLECLVPTRIEDPTGVFDADMTI